MASNTIPKIMKGVLVEKTGGVEVLEYKTDLPVPEPKEGQILVKNDYIGINYIDTYIVPPLPSPLLDKPLKPHPATTAQASTPPQNRKFSAPKQKAPSSQSGQATCTTSNPATAWPGWA